MNFYHAFATSYFFISFSQKMIIFAVIKKYKSTDE